MPKHPTRASADDDGDDSTSTRPDDTQTDGTPADQSHADDPAQQAEDAEDRGGVNPDAPGPHSEVTDPSAGDDTLGPPASREDGGMIDEDKVADLEHATLDQRVQVDRMADELAAALRDIRNRLSITGPPADNDPDTARSLEGTLAGRLRALTLDANAIVRHLEAESRS